MSAVERRCPLMDATVPVMQLSRSRGARSSLTSLSACRDCPAGYSPETCPLRSAFNNQLQVAIQAVLGEYQFQNPLTA